MVKQTAKYVGNTVFVDPYTITIKYQELQMESVHGNP